MRLPYIDASIGDPGRPFTHAAQYAFKKTRKVLHQYDNYGEYERKVIFSIMNYFNDVIGIKRQGWTGVGTDCFVITNGTTEGFAMLMAVLGKEAREYNELTHQKTEPVILMPVPTYGLFFRQPEEHGIKVVKFAREADGSVDPKKLDDLITSIHAAGEQRVIAYYDSNPNNPTGYIRDQAQTRALGEVFKKHNDLADDKMAEDRKKVARDDRWRLREELSNRIRIIDDMVYLGTEYGDKKPAPFMADETLFNDTFLITGGSKIGLAALRAGIVIGHPNYAKKIHEKIKSNQYFPPIPALHALEAAFSMEPEHMEAKKTHLNVMNAEHQFSGKFMKALINGIDSVEVTASERRRMAKAIMQAHGTEKEDANERLKAGIKDVKVVTNPEAGFFHLLDFSALKGKYYSNNAIHYKAYCGSELVKDEWALQHTHRASRLAFCSGTFVGFPIEDMIVRTSFAMPPEKIVELVDRIEYSLGWFADNEKDAKFASPEKTPYLQI